MNAVERYSEVIGRILIAVIFLVSGFRKAVDWEGTAGYMEAMGMVAVPLFLILAMIVELAGGLSLLSGFKVSWGALALFLFLIPVTLIFHGWWRFPEDEQEIEMIMFLKNLAIMGGLLFIFARSTASRGKL